MGVDEFGFVLTGISGSRLDQPSEFIESRKDVDAIAVELRVGIGLDERRDCLKQ